MNLCDFEVTKILSEEYGPLYKLYGLTVDEVEEELNPITKNILYSQGVKQKYEYDCYGQLSVSSRISLLSEAYKVGDKGVC